MMTAASGAPITLVASSRPPSPTSSTTMSQRSRRYQSRATAVISSNSVGWSAIASAIGRISVTSAASVSSAMGSPFICMRSLKRKR